MTVLPKVDAPTASASVLVVDDEPALCQALRMILELEGYRVITAADEMLQSTTQLR